MGIEFRFATENDYGRIAAFLDQHWASNHVYTRDRALFDWTFGRHSHWNREGYSFSLAEEDGELIGTLGGIPFTFNNEGRTSEGVWIANYALRPDYRKGATAFKLLDTFRGEPYDLTVACGLNPQTTVIYRVLRGRVLPPMPRHLATMPGCESRMADLIATAHPDWEADRVARASEAFALAQPKAAPPECGTSLPDSWDSEDWPVVARETIGAVRDSDYLNWRYRDHPTFEYQFLTVPDGKRTGLIVWRRETIHVREGEELRPFDDFIRIVELLPTSRQNARDLISALTQIAIKSDALGFDFFGYDSISREYLTEMGIRAVDSEPDGRLIPTRFQPLDGKSTEMFNAMFASDSTPECALDSDCRWYWTKSDSDQDRPN